jgi:hypothetical protein
VEDCAAVPRRSLATLLAIASTGLAVGGCGEQNPDRDFGTYTDCATVGRLSFQPDPSGDQRGGEAPEGDLVGLRLARSGDRLCVDFETRDDVRSPTIFALVMRPGAADTPVVQLQVAVLASAEPEIIVRSSRTARDRDGEVGIRGTRLSVIISKATLDAAAGASAAGVFEDFRWQARTAVSPSKGDPVTDCAIDCR